MTFTKYKYNVLPQTAPSRPSKHGGRDQLDVARQQELLASPIKPRFNESSLPAALASSLSLFPALSAARKVVPPAAAKNAAPLALPLPAVLRQPEEQTDNWDDDFEEGISFSKLQGIPRRILYTKKCPHLSSLTALEKSTVDEERQQPEHDDNAQTIRPTNRSPRSAPGVISKSPSRDIGPIVEDYSDLGIDEDDEWQEKFADFKTKTSVRRGLFHPNDIKTVGLAPASPSAKSAPLPDALAMGHLRTQSHPLNHAVTPLSASPFAGPTSARSHSRSPSFAGSSNGSFGRSVVRRLSSQEFNKYAEDDDEDYDDVFGKPNGSCTCSSLWFLVYNAVGWANC
jgi:hypothetical protein